MLSVSRPKKGWETLIKHSIQQSVWKNVFMKVIITYKSDLTGKTQKKLLHKILVYDFGDKISQLFQPFSDFISLSFLMLLLTFKKLLTCYFWYCYYWRFSIFTLHIFSLKFKHLGSTIVDFVTSSQVKHHKLWLTLMYFLLNFYFMYCRSAGQVNAFQRHVCV